MKFKLVMKRTKKIENRKGNAVKKAKGDEGSNVRGRKNTRTATEAKTKEKMLGKHFPT